ncbi:hypothetical protein BST61_g11500 [Cercospora zeina]
MAPCPPAQDAELTQNGSLQLSSPSPRPSRLSLPPIAAPRSVQKPVAESQVVLSTYSAHTIVHNRYWYT